MQRNLVPAAEYLRMSTDNQRYSLENQSAAIKKYATDHGFQVVKTYSDAGRSGLLLRNRPALKQLLCDVIGGQVSFAVILVYDVSRWGRFQDSDEAAHYEFLCKRSRIQVVYCAETFPNDDSLTSTVLKSVKRAMAAEYSRELGEKVFAAERRWAERGFKQGGAAGYGLQRAMVSSSGEKKQLLARGETKCLQSDRVILVPGDIEEVRCVQEIFRLVVDEKRTPVFIAAELNRRGVTYRGRKWCHQNVYRILTHPKYAGYSVWNRNTRRLGRPDVKVPTSEWVLTPGAYEAVVDPGAFKRAQVILSQRKGAKSNKHI